MHGVPPRTPGVTSIRDGHSVAGRYFEPPLKSGATSICQYAIFRPASSDLPASMRQVGGWR